MKKLIAATTVAAVVTLGAAGTAFAADDGSDAGSSPPPSGQHAPGRMGAIRHRALRIGAEAAAKAIGVEVSELREALRNGQSVAAFATSKGVDVSTVTDAIVKALTEKLDQAVKNGKITEERAAKAKERLPELVDKLVNRVPRSAPSGGAAQT